jgi:Tol biopolymer transport system component
MGSTNAIDRSRGIYSAQVAFDTAGQIIGLTASTVELLIANADTHDWSPDGGQIVYSVGPHPSADLYILDLPTHQVRKLTSGIAPVWSPDGSHIAFRRGHDSILTIQPDGSGLQSVLEWPAPPGMTYTYPRPGYYEVVWSPDAHTLLYGCLELNGDARDIYRIAWTGGEPQKVTRGVLGSAVPVAWLEEGER